MDTIYALATPRGRGGVAVIRLSGPGAHAALASFGATEPPMRRAALRRLFWQGDVLDDALVILFPRGESFTGEAVAELHLHGSRAIVDAALRALADLPGLRLAEPGEFTRRALENGRMDLTQVEGLADLIDAETEAQRRQAQRVFSGAMGRKIETWRAKLIRAAALVEATIDFADEEVPQDVGPEVSALMQAVLDDLRRERDGFAAAERVRDGFEVAIVGKPNAGKSTLLNSLAGREAAITSSIAGTTRDVIEVRMDIGGLAVTLLDTAGLREDAADEVEAEGIRRALDRARAADLRIFLLSSAEEDLPLDAGPDDIVLLNRGDERTGGGSLPAVSGKTGQGVDALLSALADKLGRRAATAGIVVRERQRLAVQNAITALDACAESLRAANPQAEIAALHFRNAMRQMEFLIGRTDVESLLDEIFSSFCIGK